jgi:perosamine synthetase
VKREATDLAAAEPSCKFQSVSERIPIAGPWITEREVRYAAEAAANDWYGQAGTALKRFERAFADYIGVKYAVAVPHCTAALHLALSSLRIGQGHEVIVPEITWVASAAPICYVGAAPVFADIDPETWCVSPASIRRLITPRTRAIMTVDLYGSPPEMDEIRAIAAENGLAIIEDAAQAVGTEYHGRKAGSLGDAAAFSFHGSKTLTTGEGGMLVTDRQDIWERTIFLRDHGRPSNAMRTYQATEVGYKYKMSGLQAAFGLAQLERVEELVTRKRDIFRWYAERLRDIPGLALNVEREGTLNTYWMVTIVLDAAYGMTGKELQDRFDEQQIEARPFFHPLSAQPAFAQVPDCAAARERNVVAHGLSPRALNLPSALTLTEAQVDRVCTTLRAFLRRS